MKKIFLNIMVSGLMALAPVAANAAASSQSDDKQLAETIRNDKSLDEVVSLAKKLLSKGLMPAAATRKCGVVI